MKKIITLCLTLVLGCMTSFADDLDHTFEFCDANGTTIADGTVITVDKVVEDDFGSKIVSSGLYVKNTSDSPASLKVNFKITEMPNGSLQICFPINCIAKNNTGQWDTGSGEMSSFDATDLSTIKSLACEWSPTAYGKCVTSFQLKPYNTVTKTTTNGPTVTVNFVYPDPSGVTNVTTDSNATEVAYYNAAGQRIFKLSKGLNIIKLSNGKAYKKFIK
jgi:hypothetical protein